ncbi:unnamed protein product [Discosporangium mesarthrocarpum]
MRSTTSEANGMVSKTTKLPSSGATRAMGQPSGHRRPRPGSSKGEEIKEVPVEVDLAAPSQDEIRRMIERIRRQANMKSARRGDRVRRGHEKVGGIPTEQRKGAGDGSEESGIGLEGRVKVIEKLQMSDLEGLEDEDRELRKKAQELETEIMAVKQRRLEVQLVKIEQDLRVEADTRLKKHHARVKKEADVACQALRSERDKHVKQVVSFKDGLHRKLEQLCAMYEEVSTRLQILEKAYSDAEEKVHRQAWEDLQVARHQEECAISQQMQSLASRGASKVVWATKEEDCQGGGGSFVKRGITGSPLQEKESLAFGGRGFRGVVEGS